ncbi:uncharacterized protein LOC143240566 isoform X2 [Tachypleus tridentatus]
MESAISRKKKYPDLAYKHEFILCNGDGVESSDSQDTGSGSGGDCSEQGSRARPTERITRGSFRSKSADPGLEQRIKLMVQSYPPSRPHRNPTLTGDAPIVPKATEYQSKFAWPGDGPELTEACRIAYSGLKMTEDRSSDSQEGLVEGQNVEVQTILRKRDKRTEYKSNFQPFSAYVYVDGNWKKNNKLRNAEGKPLDETNPWYSEVVERIKKADEYRVRSQGTPFYGEQSPLIQGKPVEGDSPLSTDVLIAMSRPLFREEKPISPRKRSVSAHPPAVLQTGEIRQKEESLSFPRSVCSERKTERTPEGQHETSHGRQPRTFREVLSTRKPVRPASVPRGEPSIKSTGTTTPPYIKPRPVPCQSQYSMVNGEDTKLWVKPTTADQEKRKDMINGEKLEKYSDGDGKEEPLESKEKGNHEMSPQTEEKDTVRPISLQETNGFNGDAESKSSLPISEPPTGPVPLTTVMSPEELTGVKSPVPETWTVPLERNKELEWTNCYTAADIKRMKCPPDLLAKSKLLPENGELIKSGV